MNNGKKKNDVFLNEKIRKYVFWRGFGLNTALKRGLKKHTFKCFIDFFVFKPNFCSF